MKQLAKSERILTNRHGARFRCEVTLSADLETIITQLGTQALRNKSKRSHEIGGLIEARVRVIMLAQDTTQ